MAWFLPPASPTVSGLASPHPTSQIKTLDIIAAILMDTQHTWFIQPQLFKKKKKSHYQFLLIIQPFRTTRTAREALLTTGARGAFLCVCLCMRASVCVCAHQEQERILTHERSLFLEEADSQPRVRLAPSLADKPFTWRALGGSKQCAPT